MPTRYLLIIICSFFSCFYSLQAYTYSNGSSRASHAVDANNAKVSRHDKSTKTLAEVKKPKAPCTGDRFYTFSWPMNKDCEFYPRGGTTTGTQVKLDTQLNAHWLALQNPKLSKFERDRHAILAMAGAYQTSFDFLEIVGFSSEFKPDKPYQSWGTEYVYVVDDQPTFISLQHIMVMFFKQGDQVQGPMVMKHWRQDWHYQKSDLFVYAGHQQWQHQTLARKTIKGTWAQSVYQVDDAPRYESYGTWEHNANFSTWRSALTWRPLPRREYSVRQDYDVLEGYNRHTILPNGWVQEEENLKLKLNTQKPTDANRAYLSKELGVNRYRRIQHFDFSAGDLYWKKTGEFWRIVRQEWQQKMDQKTFKLLDKVKGQELYQPFFEYAENLNDQSSEEIRNFVRTTLNQYVMP